LYIGHYNKYKHYIYTNVLLNTKYFLFFRKRMGRWDGNHGNTNYNSYWLITDQSIFLSPICDCIYGLFVIIGRYIVVIVNKLRSTMHGEVMVKHLFFFMLVAYKQNGRYLLL